MCNVLVILCVERGQVRRLTTILPSALYHYANRTCSTISYYTSFIGIDVRFNPVLFGTPANIAVFTLADKREKFVCLDRCWGVANERKNG